MELTSRKALWIVVALIYPGLMSILWLTTPHSYSEINLILNDRWWFIAGIAFLMLILVKVSKLKVQFSQRINRSGWLMIFAVGIVIAGGVNTLTTGEVNWSLVIVTLLGTFFVGLGEELAYRGLILNALIEHMSVVRSVVVSSVLFGIMHSVNILKQPLNETVTQVVFTFLIGLAFGWVYVSTGGNLVLVVVLHWLYDAFLMIPISTSAGSNTWAIFGVLILYTLAITFTLQNRRQFAGKTWTEIRLSLS